MQGISRVSAILAVVSLWGSAAFAQEDSDKTQVLVSVADQRLVVVRDGMWLQKFPVSTSKFGEGDSYGSYKTPLGKLRVCGKIGGGLPLGAVMHHRNATGEILQVNARGRDPIVTRIIWLEGLEACNARAKSRGIYIHGTVEESKIGRPASYGCIRMKSEDVTELFDMLPVGTLVSIQPEKLPRLKRWTPPAPQILASKEAAKAQAKLAKAEEKAAAAEKKAALLAAEHASEKPEAKIALAKAEKPKVFEPAAKPSVASPHVPEKPEPRFAIAKTTPKPITFASAKPATLRAPIVIRSNGWAEEAKSSSSEASAAATLLQESILFADLPGHGAQRGKN